jgi:metallo-beta-lactamase family protein
MENQDALSLTFLGAAQTVTGSMHLLEAAGAKLLVDCGLFQGRREESRQRNRNLPAPALGADAVILTHGHIDHCGNLPNLVKRGFAGRIHCTAATAEITVVMLRDAARIQVSDAKWLNRKHEGERDWIPIEPLYDEEDAERALKLLEPHPYETEFAPRPGLTARFVDAGHVLGSASVIVDVKPNGGGRRRVVFSGDIGRKNLPILRDPVVPEGGEFVVMESTYGDRLHAPAEGMRSQLLDAINTARARGGKIIIPSFALERAQEIVFALNQLLREGALAPIPVYLDSPLTVNLTEIFRRHPECYDAEALSFGEKNGDPFGFGLLTMIESVEESKRLNDLAGPAVIISASGMCEAGRVLHHLQNNIENPKNMIVIVGFQAQHTLGRRIVERRPRVRIFGVERDLCAEVRVLNAFSAHADWKELVEWAGANGRQVRRFFLVHGEPETCRALQGRLAEAGLAKAEVPAPLAQVPLEA